MAAGKYFNLGLLEEEMGRKTERIKADKDLSKRNKEIILQYLRDSELGKTIKKGQKRKIGPARNLQVSGHLLNMAKHWFKKDLDKVDQEDMERFIMALEHGRIKSKRGKPYSSATKSNIKKFIRKFYKWLLGNSTIYPDFVDWLDTSREETFIEAVQGLDKGVHKIVELIPDLRRKALTMVAFDSGFRSSELINCRLRDVERGEDGTYFITCRVSKTKRRTVSLPYSSDILHRWLEKHPKKNKPDAQLWQTSRVMFFKTVNLYAKKALGQHVTIHMLRHTSATFWSQRIDRTSLCKRFGWAYSSDVPDRYIDFAKVSEKKIIDVAKADQYDSLRREIENLKAANLDMVEKMRRENEEALAAALALIKQAQAKQ